MTLAATLVLGLALVATCKVGGVVGQQQNDGQVPPEFAPAPSSQPAGATTQPFGLSASVAPGVEGARLNNTGTATTAYSTEPLSPYGAVSLGCGLGFISPTFTTNYLGVGSTYFQKGMACGRCVTIRCDDVSCANPGSASQTVALVVDTCGECFDADLTISALLFKNISGRDPGSNPSIQVSWQYLPPSQCAQYIAGTIKMLVKQGGTAYYQAFGLSNSVQPILGVMVNGENLKLGTDNMWQWNPGNAINPNGPFNFALLGANRQVLRVQLRQLRSADLGVQFNPT